MSTDHPPPMPDHLKSIVALAQMQDDADYQRRQMERQAERELMAHAPLRVVALGTVSYQAMAVALR